MERHTDIGEICWHTKEATLDYYPSRAVGLGIQADVALTDTGKLIIIYQVD